MSEAKQGGPAPVKPQPRQAPSDTGQLGEAAKRLLDDPVLALAMERVQEKLFDSWRHTAPGELEAREMAYRLYWAAEQFRSELRIMLGNARALEAKARLNVPGLP